MEYIVNTPCGAVRGHAGRVPGTVAFKGIRYATAGRWEYPKPVTHWDGVYEAAEYGACCYQPRSFYNEEENLKKVFYYNEFRKGETYTYSEDCQFLNIFTPENAKEGDNGDNLTAFDVQIDIAQYFKIAEFFLKVFNLNHRFRRKVERSVNQQTLLPMRSRI